MIQVCVHNVCLVCQDFKNFLEDKTVKFVTVDFGNDKEVLRQIGLAVGNPFDLQMNRLVPSRSGEGREVRVDKMVEEIGERQRCVIDQL